MPVSRNDQRHCRRGPRAVSLAGRLLLALIATAVAAPAGAQTTPQLRLGAPTRLGPPPAPDAAPSAAPQGEATPSGGEAAIVVNPLAPIDPDWAGPLTAQQGAFPSGMWLGTPRPLVAALVPRLPVTASPTLQSLTRRLLLSSAAAPARQGSDDANLVELRVERLVAAGQLAAADAVLGLMPNRAASEPLERRSVELALLANARQPACERVGEDIRRFKDIWWTRALIACQALAGDTAKAALGVELLREQKAPKDEAFDALIAILTGGKGKVEKLPDPSPLHLVLLAAAKQPLPNDALAAASPGVLRAWAAAEGAPIAQRVAAGERAAALGALPFDDLRQLYGKLEFSADDRANAVTKSAGEKAGRGRALLYTTASTKTVAAARAELLQAMFDQARKTEDLVVAARIAEPLLLDLKPASELAWFAGDATRGLVAAGHPAEARAWLAVADPDQTRALYPLARLALGRDGPPADAKALAAALAPRLANGDAGVRQAALALALLQTFDEPVGPADWAPLAGKLPLTSLDLPGAPIWFDLPRAAAGKRFGETVLLALVTAGEGDRVTAQPARLTRALEALRAINLDGDARALAVEAAIAGGL